MMNKLKNKVQLIGHLGQTPEIISFENGKKLAKMRMATNESYKTPTGEKITDTQWHNLVAWGKQAEIFEKYAGKGQELMIEGKIITRSYETKDGEKRFITEIQIHDFQFLGNNEKKSA